MVTPIGAQLLGTIDQCKHTIGVDVACDFYNGSKAALIKAGIAKDGDFPGDPGRGRTAVTIHSELAAEAGERPRHVPGYRVIRRSGDGFSINVTVDRETQMARGLRSPPEAVELKHSPGGSHEFWSGTKEQLQAEGIGVGAAFPGEPGAGQEVHVTDPNGFPAVIRSGGDGRRKYYVYSSYRPAEERREAEAAFKSNWVTQINGGVTLDRSCCWADTYTGAHAALVALGLARADEFPGQPGRGKTMATYGADGTLIPKGGNGGRSGGPGWRQIKRVGRDRFSIMIRVDDDEVERRRAEHKAFDEEQKALDREAMAKRQRPQERAKEAALAKRELDKMPQSADEYCKQVAASVRHTLRIGLDMVFDTREARHGYTIDAEPIAMSLDAVVEAVLQAEVSFDARLHRKIEQGHRATLAAADGTFRLALDRLTKPNLALVEGEM